MAQEARLQRCQLGGRVPRSPGAGRACDPRRTDQRVWGLVRRFYVPTPCWRSAGAPRQRACVAGNRQRQPTLACYLCFL